MTREEAINEIKSWDFLDEKEIEAIQTLIPELEENEDEKIIMTINNILPFIHDEAYTNNGTTKKDVLNWLEKQKEYVADNRKASTSYDDRIRKAIIKSIEEDSSVYEQEVSKEQMIAYLEKQKDASKAIEAVDRIDKYIDEHLANAHDMKDSNPDKKYYRGWDDALGKMAGILQDVYSNEKQKEQKHYWKPTETDVALFNKAVTTNNTLTPAERANLDIIRSKFSCCRAINCSGIMQKEQKPAGWSEDFENNIRKLLHDKLIWHSDDGSMSSAVFIDDKTIKDIVTGIWFYVGKEAMKNPNMELPKQEWSEEDERMLLETIRVLESGRERYIDEFGHLPSWHIVITWLKSLRPQPKKELSIEKAIQWLDDTFIFLDNSSGRGKDCEITTHDFDSLEEMYDSFRKAVIVDSEPRWKPSEEQMEALCNAIAITGTCGSLDAINTSLELEMLYEQLKKLI